MTRNQATEFVNDIDADLNPEQIKGDIGKARPTIDVGQIKITSIKSNRNGSQTAIIEIERTLKGTLIGDRRIRIGWVACRAYPKMAITRCYRCLGFGHRASECKGEERSNACINCGKAGHKVKECKGNATCTTCELDGLMADSTACPMFRRLTRESRDRGAKTTQLS
ncbi:hypothetical protein JTB14_035487 [Gonioctena quinquepunctata]|nr:hypothetical protein JTB14_035487 [Gonioctena quinquepunctata]